MKVNKILLYVKEEIFKKVNVDNVALIFNTSQLFNLPRFSKLSLSFIRRCFPMLSDLVSFSQLEIVSAVKILSSKGLNVDSELEVLKAALSWLNHIEQRSKHAKRVLSHIRFSLLSARQVKQTLSENLSLTNETRHMVNEIFYSKKKESCSLNSKIPCRFSSDKNFNIVYCGGERSNSSRATNDVHYCKSNEENSFSTLPAMIKSRESPNVVYLKDGIYVFGGFNNQESNVQSVEKYSLITKSWKTITNMYDDRDHYCVIAFMDSVYVIGSWSSDYDYCVSFNTKNQSWKEISATHEPGFNKACAVFQGKIVVSGGLVVNSNALRSVEVYDDSTWSLMPEMIEARERHKMVAVRSKLFFIGGRNETCEVFDSESNKFTFVHPPERLLDHLQFPTGVVLVGEKFLVFGNEEGALLFDTEQNEWLYRVFDLSINLSRFGCTKIPQLQMNSS